MYTEDIPFVIFIIFQCIFQLFQIAVTLLSVVTLNRVVFAEPPPPNGFGNSFSALNLHLQAPHDSHSNSHHEHSFGMQKKKNTMKIFIRSWDILRSFFYQNKNLNFLDTQRSAFSSFDSSAPSSPSASLHVTPRHGQGYSYQTPTPPPVSYIPPKPTTKYLPPTKPRTTPKPIVRAYVPPPTTPKTVYLRK